MRSRLAWSSSGETCMRVMMRKIVPNSVCEQLLHSYGTTALGGCPASSAVRLCHATCACSMLELASSTAMA